MLIMKNIVINIEIRSSFLRSLKYILNLEYLNNSSKNSLIKIMYAKNSIFSIL